MLSRKSDKFLAKAISYIKFPPDREKIKRELQDHIEDKIEHYKNRGLSEEEAEELSINDMGEAKLIGLELNKQHNPIIGWIWYATNIIMVLSLIISIFYIGYSEIASLVSKNYYSFSEEDVQYKVVLDEKIIMDDRVILFKEVIYKTNQDLIIVCENYENIIRGKSWNFSNFGTIKDSEGVSYPYSSSSTTTASLARAHSKTTAVIRYFPEDIDKIYIEYDYYNRYYKIEIDLRGD